MPSIFRLAARPENIGRCEGFATLRHRRKGVACPADFYNEACNRSKADANREKLGANACETESLRNKRTQPISTGGTSSNVYHAGATLNVSMRNQRDRRPARPSQIDVNVRLAMHGPSNMTGKIINPVNFGTTSRRTSQGMTNRELPSRKGRMREQST